VDLKIGREMRPLGDDIDENDARESILPPPMKLSSQSNRLKLKTLPPLLRLRREWEISTMMKTTHYIPSHDGDDDIEWIPDEPDEEGDEPARRVMNSVRRVTNHQREMMCVMTTNNSNSKKQKKNFKHQDFQREPFLKQKFKPDGTPDKVKACLVARGHMQDETLYSDTSSPTVNITNVFMEASINAMRGMKCATADIGSAYLNAEMKENIFMTHLNYPL
jgi:hypothetical protein